MTDPIVPTRAAGLAQLAAFAPRSGLAYAAGRNTDRGPAMVSAASLLSPYLRRRLILEHEVVAAVSAEQGEAARKFIEEVFWRTYWKGFLEQHPTIWAAYRQEVRQGWNRLAVESGLREAFHAATTGSTGIEAFDSWAVELVAESRLHNHARMWFASIWIFTLRLPWALGADFFARHLIDGDPASNTLSWRWVAGLHTSGKPYVATAENIARFTDGRFNPRGQLDEAPAALTEPARHAAIALPAPDAVPQGEVALLLHDDDLCGELLDLRGGTVRAVAAVSAVSLMARNGVAEPVEAFVSGALTDGLARAGAHFGCATERIAPDGITAWIRRTGLPVVTPWAPCGPASDALAGVPVLRVRRAWDEAAWPFCRRGYFQLRPQIEAFVAAFPEEKEK